MTTTNQSINPSLVTTTKGEKRMKHEMNTNLFVCCICFAQSPEHLLLTSCGHLLCGRHLFTNDETAFPEDAFTRVHTCTFCSAPEISITCVDDNLRPDLQPYFRPLDQLLEEVMVAVRFQQGIVASTMSHYRTLAQEYAQKCEHQTRLLQRVGKELEEARTWREQARRSHSGRASSGLTNEQFTLALDQARPVLPPSADSGYASRPSPFASRVATPIPPNGTTTPMPFHPTPLHALPRPQAMRPPISRNGSVHRSPSVLARSPSALARSPRPPSASPARAYRPPTQHPGTTASPFRTPSGSTFVSRLAQQEHSMPARVPFQRR